MEINETIDDLWQFCNYLIPSLNIAGAWSVLLSGKVQPNQKKASKNIYPTNIHSTVTEVDILIQEMILKSILERYSNISPFGEEDTFFNSKPKTSPKKCFYITVDPIDGTYAYTQGENDYCIMISLFDKNKLLLGIIHFPALNETLVGILNDGLYRIQYKKINRNNPHQIDNIVFNKISIKNCIKHNYISAHYRFFKEPFKHIGQKLFDNNYRFKTLLGDDENAVYIPACLGSNGSLIRDYISGNSIAYIAPYIAYHDLLPLAALVASDDGIIQFYELESKINWERISHGQALSGCIQGTKRCRAILTKDLSMLKKLEKLLSL